MSEPFHLSQVYGMKPAWIGTTLIKGVYGFIPKLARSAILNAERELNIAMAKLKDLLPDSFRNEDQSVQEMASLNDIREELDALEEVLEE